MEVDLVDPVAVPVVRSQDRRVVVRVDSPLLSLGRTRQPTELGQSRLGSRARVAAYALDECGVGTEDVVVDERRWLIADLVRGAHRDTSPKARTQNATRARTKVGSSTSCAAWFGDSGPTSASPMAPTRAA